MELRAYITKENRALHSYELRMDQVSIAEGFIGQRVVFGLFYLLSIS